MRAQTRLCQYEALNNGKGVEIAKQIVLAKMKGQNSFLEKHDLKPHNEETITAKIEKLDSSELDPFRKRLTGIEGKFSQRFFRQMFARA